MTDDENQERLDRMNEKVGQITAVFQDGILNIDDIKLVLDTAKDSLEQDRRYKIQE